MDAGGLGKACQFNGGIAVDRIRKLWIELSQRVIRQRSEMNDRLDTPEILVDNVADILDDLPNGG
jgi:hypothetical protein